MSALTQEEIDKIQLDYTIAADCSICDKAFHTFRRKQQCKQCGRAVCKPCCKTQRLVPASSPFVSSDEQGTLLRICDGCSSVPAPSVNNSQETASLETQSSSAETSSISSTTDVSAPPMEEEDACMLETATKEVSEVLPTAEEEEMTVVKGAERATLIEKSIEAEECAICLDPMNTGAVYQTACGHKFHFKCLKDIQKSDVSNFDKCPSCRTVMKEMQVKKTCEHPRARRNHKFCRDCGAAVSEADFKPRPEEAQAAGRNQQFQVRFQRNAAAQPPPPPHAAANNSSASYRAGSQGAIVRCPQCQMQMRVLPHMFNMRVACPRGHQFQVAVSNQPIPPGGRGIAPQMRNNYRH